MLLLNVTIKPTRIPQGDRDRSRDDCNPPVVSARPRRWSQKVEPAPVEIVAQEVVDVSGGTRISVAKVRNTETEETAEAAVKLDATASGEDVRTANAGAATEVIPAKSGAVEMVQPAPAEDNVSTGDWEDRFFEEIPRKAGNEIERAGAYYEDLSENCDAYSEYDGHGLVGFSIELSEKLDKIAPEVVGGITTAAVGALVSGGTGALGGFLIGSITSYVLSIFKDSTIYTVAFKDWDICAFGGCGPALMVLGSGIWKQTDWRDMYEFGLDQNQHVKRLMLTV